MTTKVFRSITGASRFRWGVLYACVLWTALPLHAGVVVLDIDGDGWAASDANLGPSWTLLVSDQNSNVWASGLPSSGRGVAFSGPPTLGQPGLFDDHIAESNDLAANLDLLAATEISFQFFQASTLYSPNALSVYIQDAQFDDWYLNIAPPATAGWSPYQVSLHVAAGWYSPTGGSNFASALAAGATQQMGIRLQYEAGSSVEQQYGLADYQVLNADPIGDPSAIPEPSTLSLVLYGTLLVVRETRKRRSARPGPCR